ncbi:MAG: pentapeptide repeat-containing protein [Gammaproteobacteria bacterium]|nr:pentapeptide repeat-containing protein [Gammaproteobacteria bacterium]MCW8986693.1 pentapeptide repeat-containing protein [Gammaproteobacteria bacterium]
MNITKAWYIRSPGGGETKGPFPGGQISQEIVLGRHKLTDEVSHDKEEWFVIRDIPELLPEVFTKNRDKPDFKNRLDAARRWADERRGISDIDKGDERRSNVSYESEEIKRLHRLAIEAKKESNPVATFVQLSFVLVAIITVIVLAFQYSPEDENIVDCAEPAKQGVNWSGCKFIGAQLFQKQLVAANLMNANLQTANLQSSDLSHANLKYAQLHLTNLVNVNFTKANLTGADLMGANLSGAVLQQANLSYANFRDAIINDADFSNARLGNAIWIDGRTCSVNSVGSCN